MGASPAWRGPGSEEAAAQAVSRRRATVTITIEWSAEPTLATRDVRPAMGAVLSTYAGSAEFRREVKQLIGAEIESSAAKPSSSPKRRKCPVKRDRFSRKRGGSSQKVNQLVRDQFRDLYRG